MPTVVAFLLWNVLLLSSPGAQEQARPGAARAAVGELFAASDGCLACHNGLVTPSGEDVSIGIHWRASMMANSARDPYWHAAVRREVLDHPAAQAVIENECAACHMPMSRYEAKANGRKGVVFGHLPVSSMNNRSGVLAADGAGCTMCHQIRDEKLGTREGFTAGFEVDTATPFGRRVIFGPFDVDRGRTRIMQSASEFVPAKASHLARAEFCAPCHTLFTHALGPDGAVLGELPEQVPYLEWKHSGYRETKSCQSCHMPEVSVPTAVSSVWGDPRPGLSRHDFRGGNFFMQGLLNRHRDELGVRGPAQELGSAVHRTVQHLQADAARVAIEEASISAGRLEAAVSVQNLAGHKLPTAYPSRRTWLHFSVLDARGQVVFDSGNLRPDGSIQGNDNDTDGSRYEPHHHTIERNDQVQVYEAIMVDSAGSVTTGLLKGVRFAKDNRILPLGFDKATASADVAVQGAAREDSDFGAGSDRVRYAVALRDAAGPYRVRAELWYQPIAFRWARNLAGRDAAEIVRFVAYYDGMAASSAVVLAHTECAVK